MKKLFLISAAVISLVSCNKEENDGWSKLSGDYFSDSEQLLIVDQVDSFFFDKITMHNGVMTFDNTKKPVPAINFRAFKKSAYDLKGYDRKVFFSSTTHITIEGTQVVNKQVINKVEGDFYVKFSSEKELEFISFQGNVNKVLMKK